MIYLHKSVFQSHGYLSSANCHVDSRWVLKVSGFALHAFRNESYSKQVSKRYTVNDGMSSIEWIFTEKNWLGRRLDPECSEGLKYAKKMDPAAGKLKF